MEIFQPHAFPRQAVDVGRGNYPAVVSHIAPTQIVSQNDNYVRTLFSSFRTTGKGHGGKGSDSQCFQEIPSVCCASHIFLPYLCMFYLNR
jgi:hypothetical protein